MHNQMLLLPYLYQEKVKLITDMNIKPAVAVGGRVDKEQCTMSCTIIKESK